MALQAAVSNQPPLRFEHARSHTARARSVSCLGFQAALELLSRAQMLIYNGQQLVDELDLVRILDPPRTIDVSGARQGTVEAIRHDLMILYHRASELAVEIRTLETAQLVHGGLEIESEPRAASADVIECIFAGFTPDLLGPVGKLGTLSLVLCTRSSHLRKRRQIDVFAVGERDHLVIGLGVVSNHPIGKVLHLSRVGIL